MTEVEGLARGDDGRLRCAWCIGSDDYRAYHDDEWGRPVTDDVRLYEKISLEGFQSGLAWITVLRKREAFRRAFADFDPTVVARFGDADVERLLQDVGIIRHRGKIEAAIANARATLAVQAAEGSLSALIWSFAPKGPSRAPLRLSEIAASTGESTALSRELRRRGFRFIGPITAYAAMQSLGLVNDHIEGCSVRDACHHERLEVLRDQEATRQG